MTDSAVTARRIAVRNMQQCLANEIEPWASSKVNYSFVLINDAFYLSASCSDLEKLVQFPLLCLLKGLSAEDRIL